MARELNPDAVMAVVERRMGGDFVWGACDCVRSAGAVFADLHGFDPTAELAGLYRDALSAARLMREAGGMVALAERIARWHRLQPVVARPGAIGLVAPAGRPVAAICLQPGAWAAKARMGFAVVPEAVAAWSI